MTTEAAGTGDQVRLVAGRYRLRELLGRGGMGCVWRAEDELLRRPVAVKEIAFPSSLAEPELATLRERTLREARAAARIDSAAAVRVYDVVEDEGRPCIVMELVEGRTLREVIRADGPLTPAETARVGLALVDALEAAHSAGIIHRDVKPGNVLVRSDGRVTLTDFGIARTAGDPSITSTGLLLGSPSYISPERARGGPPLPAADMWSLGATLFTAVEGRPPFDRGDAFATLAAVVGEPPGAYVAAGPLAPVIDRLLEKDPAARPGPAEVRTLLAKVAADPVSEQTRATTTAPLAAAEHTMVLPHARRAAPGPAASMSPPDRRVPPPGVRVPRRVGRSRGSGLGAAVAVLLVAALGAAAAFAFLGGDRTGRRSQGAGPAGGSSPSAAARTGSSARPSSSAKPPAKPTAGSTKGPVTTGLPVGWVRYTDPVVGWSFGHPASWPKRTRKGGMEFVDPSGNGYVRVDSKSPAGASALGDWEAQEKRFMKTYPDYRRLQLKTVSVQGYDDAAIWEFVYSTKKGGSPLHALDLGLVTGGRGYAVYFQTLDSAWAASSDELQTFLSSFRPAP